MTNVLIYPFEPGFRTISGSDLNRMIEALNKAFAGTVVSGQLGQPNGVATLDGSGKIPVAEIPALIPGEVATANSATTLNANQSSATLYAVPAGNGGAYRVSAYAVVVTADGATSTLPSVGIGWTDVDTSVPLLATNVTSTNTANAPGAFGQGAQIINAKGGTNITWQTSNYASGTAGAMKYAVRVRVEYLG